MIYTTLASDNSSRLKKNILERVEKLIIKIDDKIRDEKVQYNINKEAAKSALSSAISISAISALSSGKIDKCEFLTGEEILLSDQSRMTEQAKFIDSPLGKALKRA